MSAIEYLETRGGGWTVVLVVPIGKRLLERHVLARSVPSREIAVKAAPVLAAAWKEQNR